MPNKFPLMLMGVPVPGVPVPGAPARATRSLVPTYRERKYLVHMSATPPILLQGLLIHKILWFRQPKIFRANPSPRTLLFWKMFEGDTYSNKFLLARQKNSVCSLLRQKLSVIICRGSFLQKDAFYVLHLGQHLLFRDPFNGIPHKSYLVLC